MIDSDGAHTAVELMAKWANSSPKRAAIVLETPAPQSRAVSVLRNDGFSRKISHLLATRFGRPNEDQLLNVLGCGR
jgi:hypothetical protein